MKPKTFLKRGAGLLTAGIMALTAFTGCSGDQGTGLFIDGKHQDIDWVMKINGEEVSMDLYRCYYLNQVQSDVNSYGDDYWNNEELYNQTKVIAESNVECYTEILRQCRERALPWMPTNRLRWTLICSRPVPIMKPMGIGRLLWR